MQFFFAVFVMHGGDEHTAGIDTHHGAGRQVGDCDAGLSNQFFRLIILVNSAQNDPICAVPSSKTNFKSFLDFFTASHSLTFTARKSLLEKVSKST